MIEINKIYNMDCLEGMKEIPDGSVNLVLTDPPYGYTNTDFDKRYFDDEIFWQEVNRILKHNAFVVFTGYGDNFYKWNIQLANLGLKFKEEIIWNKIATNSPFNVINRVHETIAIRVKGNKKLNLVKIDYVQDKELTQEFSRLHEFYKRIKSGFSKYKKEYLHYLETGEILFVCEHKSKFDVTTTKTFSEVPRGLSNLKTIIEESPVKSIFNISRDSVYKNTHPTQKPVELFERLIKLCSDENMIILDPFMGSGTTAIACMNTKRNFIGFELDKTYFDLANKRIEVAKSNDMNSLQIKDNMVI